MAGELTHTASEMEPRTPNYRMKSDVSITLRCQQCSTCYAAFLTKNCSKSTPAIHAYQKKWCRAPQYIV